MTGGYTSRILHVNLTNKSIHSIDTAQYEEYGGGHGFGSAIFWDLVADQLPFSALDPRNVITIMAGPFSGDVVPAAAGRCEVQGLGPQPYPIEWFTRTKTPYYLTVYQDGKWSYDGCTNRVLDRQKFEEWKNKFFEFEGWNSASGWPKRATLESMELKKVADTLESKGKLGE
jgi:aldehyde:ferredoxin oxidoreductase